MLEKETQRHLAKLQSLEVTLVLRFELYILFYSRAAIKLYLISQLYCF